VARRCKSYKLVAKVWQTLGFFWRPFVWAQQLVTGLERSTKCDVIRVLTKSRAWRGQCKLFPLHEIGKAVHRPNCMYGNRKLLQERCKALILVPCFPVVNRHFLSTHELLLKSCPLPFRSTNSCARPLYAFFPVPSFSASSSPTRFLFKVSISSFSMPSFHSTSTFP
jgi:hypothetical protein